MVKIDLKDVTFLIPVRIDSIVRLENVLLVVDMLHLYFDTHIMILEAAYHNNNVLKRLLPKYVDFFFVEDKDPVFYRTHYLNVMCQKTVTPFLAIWDADVIVPPHQMLDSIEQLRTYKADIAYPFDGRFLDVSEIIRGLFLKTKKLSLLLKQKDKMSLLYNGRELKGGGFLFNKEKYIKAGMENENFYGWGPEDFERYDRWKAFEYTIHRSDGVMFHLTHPRDMNGSFNSEDQQDICNMELARTRNSSAEEIRSYFKLSTLYEPEAGNGVSVNG